MESMQSQMSEFRDQLKRGVIQKAYRGLMDFMLGLKNHLANKFPEFTVTGSLYTGYMDMTYFSVLPASLKDRDLKIAIVFNYDAFCFEVWLSGKNKQVLEKYWKLLQKSQWDKYKLVEPGKGVDSILEHVLAAHPDFGDLDALTEQIEQGTLEFIQDIKKFLASVDP